MTRIDDLETTFADDIARIRKMSNNVATMNEVEFAYDRLMKLPLTMPITLDYLLEVQVLTTGLVTAYGRLFARSTGTTKLDPKALPSELRPIHQQIIDLPQRALCPPWWTSFHRSGDFLDGRRRRRDLEPKPVDWNVARRSAPLATPDRLVAGSSVRETSQ